MVAARDPIVQLINVLSKLPGIGEKSASRLAFHIINSPVEYAHELSEAIRQVKDRVAFCSEC